MKKIKEQEKKDAKKNMLVYESNALYLHKDYVTFSMCLPSEPLQTTFFPAYVADYSFDHNQSVFRPPISRLNKHV